MSDETSAPTSPPGDPGLVVTAEQLADLEGAIAADVRWYLDGRSGRDAFLEGHLPDAVYVDLDRDLADPPSSALGRHPLPSAVRFAERMSALGIANTDLVVAYDDAGGAIASRLVWMLRAAGTRAAILDGGIAAWAGPLQTGEPTRVAACFEVRDWPGDRLARIDDAARAGAESKLIDARTPDRYRGDHEPIDPRAGHVPGAINHPFPQNLDDRGRFLPPQTLRDRYRASGIEDASGAIVYCGSGVTACHNAIAMEHAGLGVPRLWDGSWSQWAHDRDRPLALGDGDER